MSARPSEGYGGAVLVTGSVASLLCTVGLALAAEAEGAAPLQPLNATSHWLTGDASGLFAGLDLRRTAVGYATNHAACLFWAVPFTAWQRLRPAGSPGALMRDALLMAAIAAAVDYGATPKRFTPGWELVLSKAGMTGGYAALALGFAAGAVLDGSRARAVRWAPPKG